MSCYLAKSFPRLIDRARVRTAMEMGSQDALDAIAIANHYDLNRVTIIEPNPAAPDLCRANIGDDSRIRLVLKAASDASSMLKISSLYGETDIKEELPVPALRIDDLIQEHNTLAPGLACMDVQNRGLIVMRSFGSKFSSKSPRSAGSH